MKRRDEDWFDAVGKNDWRQEQIEQREKDRLAQANANSNKLVEPSNGICKTPTVSKVR